MPLDYRAEELAPRKLTPEEITDPYQVIYEFFNYGHLPQIRDQLWKLLKVTITGSYSRTLSAKEKAHLLFFYEKLKKLVEANHVIHTSRSA